MKAPPSIAVRSRMPVSPCPEPADGAAAYAAGELTTRRLSPARVKDSSTAASPPGAWRSVLLSASCTMRYADNSTPGGSRRRLPRTRAVTGTPALRTLANSASNCASEGCGVVPSGLSPVASDRNRPSMWRSSARPSCAFARIDASSLTSSCGGS